MKRLIMHKALKNIEQSSLRIAAKRRAFDQERAKGSRLTNKEFTLKD